jgi:hypothetical protein
MHTMQRLRRELAEYWARRPNHWRSLRPWSFVSFWYVRYPTLATVYALLMTAMVTISLAYAAAIRPSLLHYAFWVYLALLGYSCFLILDLAVRPAALVSVEKVVHNRRRYPRLWILLQLPWLAGSLFGCASFLGWRIYGAEFMVGAEGSDLWDWVGYTIDSYVRAGLFDLAETYGLRISPIQHAAAFWPSTFVFLFRTALSIGLISSSLVLLQRFKTRDWYFSD